jgi:hypothetical protein
MTKGELIKRMRGLPDDTEIVWEDRSDGAHWTFLDPKVDVELLARVEVVEGDIDSGHQWWERLSTLRVYENMDRVRMIRMKPVVVLS